MAETGCMGMCYKEVLVELIEDSGKKHGLTARSMRKKQKNIFESHVLKGIPLPEYIVKSNGRLTNRIAFLPCRSGLSFHAAETLIPNQ
jgi:NADH-quinone oxidoreductase subunit F